MGWVLLCCPLAHLEAQCCQQVGCASILRELLCGVSRLELLTELHSIQKINKSTNAKKAFMYVLLKASLKADAGSIASTLLSPGRRRLGTGQRGCLL